MACKTFYLELEIEVYVTLVLVTGQPDSSEDRRFLPAGNLNSEVLRDHIRLPASSTQGTSNSGIHSTAGRFSKMVRMGQGKVHSLP